jgi:hypothetical protein
MEHEDAVETLAAERYILGELPETERDNFEAHFFECMDCASDIRVLSQLKEGARAAVMAEAPAPAKPVKLSWREKWTLSWFTPGVAFAAIATLATTASLTSWQYMQLRGSGEPQTVASIMLRPETRGEVAKVDVSQAGDFQLLEADLPGATGDLKWQLQPEGSTESMAEGSGAAPQAGASFKILVPSHMVQRGTYRVVVRSADGVRTWTFRFSTAGT